VTGDWWKKENQYETRNTKSGNEGLLGPSEREELEALVELSEQLSLVSGEALQILGERP